MTCGNLSKILLSLIICVFAVKAPPGIGEKGISGFTIVASGGKKYSFKQSFKTSSYLKIFSSSSPPKS